MKANTDTKSAGALHWRAEKLLGLRIGGTKKTSSQAFGGRKEKKATKENLHCVESHEAESALVFGGLESGGLV